MVFLIETLLPNTPGNLLILFEIGIMIIVAGILAFIFRIIRQPRIPAYVIAGIILGPLALGLIKSSDVVLALSEIGVAFLLFFAGLDIDFRNLKKVGKTAIFAGIWQMIIVSIIAVAIFLSWKLKSTELIYASLVVAFSSTMVVIKLLADKEEINSLHGRLIVGILLIQDVAAIIALTVMTTSLTLTTISLSLLKAILFVVFALILAKISKPILKISAKSSELILIISLGFLFIFSIAAYSFGLSLVIGSFFAGVVLANTEFKTDIKGRINPLRDFFGAILFVSLGMQLVWISKSYVWLFAILIFLIMVIKPLIIIMLIRIFGYTNRTAFLSGNYLGQSSEFALILLTQALVLNQISQNIFSILVFVTIITMSLTGYFVKYESRLYKIFSVPAKIFDRLPARKEELNYGIIDRKKIIIFGCHRMGTMILKKFSSIKNELLIIDFNPEIIHSLIQKKIPCMYGDYANPEIIKKLSMMKPEIIISTIPDMEDNMNLIEKIKKINSKAIIIVVADRIHEALELYKRGADYVILPKVVSGMQVGALIDKVKKDRKGIKKREVDFLKEIHYYMYNGNEKN